MPLKPNCRFGFRENRTRGASGDGPVPTRTRLTAAQPQKWGPLRPLPAGLVDRDYARAARRDAEWWVRSGMHTSAFGTQCQRLPMPRSAHKARVWFHVCVARDWTGAAGRWLAEFGWIELERDRFTQVDIDWFSDEVPSRPAPAALDCVRAALEAVQQRYRGIDGLVTVPLPYAERLDAEAPDLADLLGSDWEYGPGHHVVGLYVIAPALLEPVEGVEEIRVPYPTSA